MKRIYSLFVILIYFLFPTTAWGQDDFQQQKDSLLKIIKSTQGEEKLKAYLNLLTRLNFPVEELDLRLKCSSDFLAEARKQKNKDYESMAPPPISCTIIHAMLWLTSI